MADDQARAHQHAPTAVPRHLELEARWHWLISLALLLAASGSYLVFAPRDTLPNALVPVLMPVAGAVALAVRWRPNGHARRRWEALRAGAPPPLPRNAQQAPANQAAITWAVLIFPFTWGWAWSGVTLAIVTACALAYGYFLIRTIVILLPDSQARRDYAEAMRRRRRTQPPLAPPKPFNEAFMASYHRLLFGTLIAATTVALAAAWWLIPDTWVITTYIKIYGPYILVFSAIGWFNWSQRGTARHEYETRRSLPTLPSPPAAA